jgi:hypothetical protein
MPSLKALLPFSAGLIFYTSLFGVLLGFETPLGTLRPLDISLALWCALSVLWILPNLKEKRVALVVAAITLGWFTGMTLLLSSTALSGLAYLARWSVAFWSAWTLSLWLREQGEKAHVWIDIWAITFTSLGIVQYLFLPDARILFWSGWDDHLFRAFGTLLDPLFFGLMSSLTAWRGFRRLDARTGRIVLIAGLMAMVLSFSRLAIAATLGWMLLESFPFTRFKKVLPVLALTIALVILVPKDGGGEGQKLLRTSTLQARSAAAQEDVSRKASALWGSGWYTRAPNPRALAPENAKIADAFWLQVYLSGGVIGVGLILLTVLLWSKESKIAWWNVLGGLASVASFSPWILLASALIPDKKTEV